MAGREMSAIRGALTVTMGAVAGFAAANRKPIPLGVQAPFLATIVATGALASLVTASPVIIGLGAIVAPVAVGITYGSGYFAGKMTHRAIQDEVFSVAPVQTVKKPQEKPLA